MPHSLTLRGSSILERYFSEIIRLIYTRLDSPAGNDSFKLRLVRFYHLVSALYDPQRGYGADYFIAASDNVQEGSFVPVYLKIILPLTQQLAKPLDRKCAVISLTKTLTFSAKFALKYVKGWGLTCEALIKLLEMPPLPTTNDGIVVEQDVDDLSFGVGFTQLNTCKRQPRDIWPEVTDVKPWVGQYYIAANQTHDGKLLPWIRERLNPEKPELAQAFISYLNMSTA
jgi:exportin-2 (importin alpha re-exporter)